MALSTVMVVLEQVCGACTTHLLLMFKFHSGGHDLLKTKIRRPCHWDRVIAMFGLSVHVIYGFSVCVIYFFTAASLYCVVFLFIWCDKFYTFFGN